MSFLQVIVGLNFLHTYVNIKFTQNSAKSLMTHFSTAYTHSESIRPLEIEVFREIFAQLCDKYAIVDEGTGYRSHPNSMGVTTLIYSIETCQEPLMSNFAKSSS